MIDESEDGKVSAGVCYKVDENAKLTKAWETNGFYAWPGELRLTTDGEFLVRIKKIPLTELNPKSILFEIYQNGKLVHSLPLSSFGNVGAFKADSFSLNDAKIVNGELDDSWGLLDYSDIKGLSRIGDIPSLNRDHRYAFVNIRGHGKIYFCINTGEILKM